MFRVLLIVCVSKDFIYVITDWPLCLICLPALEKRDWSLLHILLYLLAYSIVTCSCAVWSVVLSFLAIILCFRKLSLSAAGMLVPDVAAGSFGWCHDPTVFSTSRSRPPSSSFISVPLSVVKLNYINTDVDCPDKSRFWFYLLRKDHNR